MNLFSKTEMVVKSPAKINLSLKITGKDSNRYHLLEMVNLPLELHDTIDVEINPYLQDTFIVCDEVSNLNGHHNLCHKAVEALKERYKFKQYFNIRIHKNIPFAAGLGGGSSNAALVLKAVNKLLKLGATNEELAEIGLKLGADIPYFLDPKPAKIEGIGEKITSISCKKKYFCLIIKPEKGLSTKDVYAISDDFEHLDIDTDKVIEGLASGNEELIESSFGNDLFAPAAKLLPEVKEVVDSLKTDGFKICGMTGSGSALYALTESQKAARLAENKYSDLGYEVILTKTEK